MQIKILKLITFIFPLNIGYGYFHMIDVYVTVHDEIQKLYTTTYISEFVAYLNIDFN